MSEAIYKPTTVREAIRAGLVDKRAGVEWTQELEDALFWPIAGLLDRSHHLAFQKGQEDTLENLRQAGVLPKL